LLHVRPALEVADIFRCHGDAFRAAQRDHLSQAQRRVMTAIEICRTAALGGHVERCEDCGETRVAYNSCLMGKFRNGELARSWSS
jgi:Transposase zinc-binding domain